ncbi:MAG: DUF421 domain-containing protein, partial [Actinomycetes bacterium]
MSEWFGVSWATIGYVVAGTAAMYGSTLVAVRIAGRRTVARLSAFDLIITTAIGSLLASACVSADPSYAQATTALVTLLLLQMAVAAARRRFPAVARLLEFEPRVVLRDGDVDLDRGLFGAQLTRAELESALRSQGVFDLSSVRLVVLEPTGEFSVARGEPGAVPSGDTA